MFLSSAQALLGFLQPCVLRTKVSKSKSSPNKGQRIRQRIGLREELQPFSTRPICKKLRVTSKIRSMPAMDCAMKEWFEWSSKKRARESWICFPLVSNLNGTSKVNFNLHRKAAIHQGAFFTQRMLQGKKLNVHLRQPLKNIKTSQCDRIHLQSISFNANINTRVRAYAVFGHSIRVQTKS